MPNPFRTLRHKVTLSYVVIFAIFQVLLWVIVNLEITRYFKDQYDEELLRRAQNIVGAFELVTRASPSAPIADRFREVFGRFESANTFMFARLHADGSVIHSANLRGVYLSSDTAADSTPGTPRFLTIEGDLSSVLCAGEPLRVVTLDIAAEAGVAYQLQVGGCLGPVLRIQGTVERLIFVFVIVSVLVAGISSWTVARRALGPIAVVAREIEQLSAERLERRLPVPANRDEIRDMVEKFNAMLERLEVQFKNCTQFISHVAHELKTPLAVMLGQVQQQRRSAADDSELAVFLDSTEEELWRLLRTVESFLILTRARDARRLEVAAEVSIEDAILRAVQICVPIAKEKNVTIVPMFSIDEDAPEPIVSGDSDLLVSMVENLISNAIRHSPPGQPVQVETRLSPREVQILVRDQGPGIADEHREFIFEFLYQVASIGGQRGHAGIGLAIVKTVVDLHGGAVSVHNLETGGCEFLVRLPLEHPRHR